VKLCALKSARHAARGIRSSTGAAKHATRADARARASQPRQLVGATPRRGARRATPLRQRALRPGI